MDTGAGVAACPSASPGVPPVGGVAGISEPGDDASAAPAGGGDVGGGGGALPAGAGRVQKSAKPSAVLPRSGTKWTLWSSLSRGR